MITSKLMSLKLDASDSWLILIREMKKRLKDAEMEALYRQIEHPLIRVLLDMEMEGFKVDKEMLQQLDVEFTAHVNRSTEEITIWQGSHLILTLQSNWGTFYLIN